MTPDPKMMPITSNHWGTYRVEVADGRVEALYGFEMDPDPSPIGNGIVDVLDGPTRISAPVVRRSWLDGGHGARTDLRGADDFVEVSWDMAEKLVARELARVCEEFGNEAIYAGSYGWASAGRFHHAQSQLKRFLNCIGGFTRSVNSYSFAAGEVVIPHVLGADLRAFAYMGPTWPAVAEHGQLVVAFGGIPLKNGQIGQGGVARHVQRDGVFTAHDNGVEFVNVSPIRSDIDARVAAQWIAPRPSTDTALLLALAHTLIAENLVDTGFVDRYTVGYEQFVAYLAGTADGHVKNAEWAAEICDIDAGVIRALARRMAASRTLLSLSWSLTRQQHGEHTYWAGVALASLLGQIGLPGRGLVFGLSAMNGVGQRRAHIPAAALPQGHNPVESFIPVARVSDMLLHPGEQFEYDGQSYEYPAAKLVYWAGGNPFHHHQDLNRMLDAWRKPDTIIVHDWTWNSMARHADVVLPCTTNLERADLALTNNDGMVAAMHQAIEPVADARNDHDIFRGIARQMGVEERFTEGRTSDEWLTWLYDQTRVSAAREGLELPSRIELEAMGVFEAPVSATSPDPDLLAAFREDPLGAPLGTPSGRIELFSDVVAGFDYDDAPGYPAWTEPTEWLGGAGAGTMLHLITNQPATKLHSQLDHGGHSRQAKIDGREPIVMHPDDAIRRGITQHDVVRVHNARGACYAAAVVDDAIRPGVVQMATGAWYDPEAPGVIGSACKHGNPNVLTKDIGTSRLAQGCSAHTCMVEIELVEGSAPPVTAYEPPNIIGRPVL